MEVRYPSQQEPPCRVLVQMSCMALEHSAVERLISAFPFHHTFLKALTHTHTFIVTKETIQTNGEVESPLIWSLAINCVESLLQNLKSHLRRKQICLFFK